MCTITPVALITRRRRGCTCAGKLSAEELAEVSGVDSCPYLFTRASQERARSVHRERIADPARQLVHRGQVAQPHPPEGYSGAIEDDLIVLRSLVAA